MRLNRLHALRAIAVVVTMLAVPASASALSSVATLSTGSPVTGGNVAQVAGFGDAVAVSTLGGVDVFEAAPGGWSQGSTEAVLVNPSPSPPPTVTSQPALLSASLSGAIAVASSGSPMSDGADVYLRPPSGWSGTLGVSARLSLPAAGYVAGRSVIQGSTVALQTRRGDRFEVDVYTEPATGWSGAIAPSARLLLPGHAGPGNNEAPAISARTIFSAAGDSTYAFSEPASGWTGTLRPSARLDVNSGPISASGRNVLLGSELVREPRHGWTGVIGAEAGIRPGGASSTLSGSLAVLGDGSCPGDGQNGCFSHLYAVCEPDGGWKGLRHSVRIARGGVGYYFLSLTGHTLFTSAPGSDSVEVYQLPDRSYGQPDPSTPQVDRAALTGLGAGHPRLTVRLSGATIPSRLGSGYVGMNSASIRLPDGLGFTARAPGIASRVIGGAADEEQLIGRRLHVRGLDDTRYLTIIVSADGLAETSALRARVRRLTAEHRHLTARGQVQIQTDPLLRTTTIAAAFTLS